jgi:MtN3 and saliva related transmembrane protein
VAAADRLAQEGRMLASVLAVCAGAWGVAMALSPLLQIRRIIAERSSRDVSIGYYVVLLIGFALWLAYGIAIGNAPLIVTNVVAFTVGCVTVAVALRHRPERRPGA